MTAAHLGPMTIEYEITGEGIPLLLVMGLGCQLIHWPDAFVQQIADHGFKVIRFDNRDMGLSTKIDGDEAAGVGRVLSTLLSRRFAKPAYLLSDMADDAANLLDHLGVDAAHVVGVSMGGMIAQTIAIEHASRVLSLTSIMSNTGSRRTGQPKPSLLAKMARLIDPTPENMMANGVASGRLISGPHFDETEERSILQRAFDRNFNPAGTMQQMMAITASPDRTPALRKLRVPTLVVHGLVDPLVQPSGGIATARAVPDSRLLMFPDMAHDLPRNRWDEIISAIVNNCMRAKVAARV
ncbi:MAG: putative hydrolase [Ilumatobacteraceae bacterium]|nr:putative hydrolase [Ilumatobacteraceae bacterium]